MITVSSEASPFFFNSTDEILLALLKMATSGSMLSGGLLRLKRDKQDLFLLNLPS